MSAFIRTNFISEHSLVTRMDAQVTSTLVSSNDLEKIRMLTYMPAFIRKSDHTLVTSTDGKVVGWGRGKEGQLGLEGNPFASQVRCSLLQSVAVCDRGPTRTRGQPSCFSGVCAHISRRIQYDVISNCVHSVLVSLGENGLEVVSPHTHTHTHTHTSTHTQSLLVSQWCGSREISLTAKFQ